MISNLVQANNGMSKNGYDEIAPTRAIVDESFEGAPINFKFSTGGQKFWMPDRSMLRIDVALVQKDAGGADIPINNAHATLAFNFVPLMFQRARLLLNNKTVSEISNYLPEIDTLYNRMNKSKAQLDSTMRYGRWWIPAFADRIAKTQARNYISVFWTPPLGVFTNDNIPMLPAGDWTLELIPQAGFETSCVEWDGSMAGNPAAPTAVVGNIVDGIRLRVKDMRFLVSTVETTREDDTVIRLDMTNLGCRSEEFKGNNKDTKTFDCDKTAYALTVAMQQNGAGSNIAYSRTKFRCQDNEEKKLESLRVSYNGEVKPNPDYNVSYGDHQDRLTDIYMRNVIGNDSFWDRGGVETQENWLENGLYAHFPWAKDGVMSATRVEVSAKYDGITAGRMLLFDHFRTVCTITVSNGRTTDVVVQSA